jgi:hypothetical protein
MSDPLSDPAAEVPPPLVRGSGSRLLAIFAGAALALVTVSIYFYWRSGPRLGEIDDARLAAARELWKQHGPASYDIEVTVSGPQAAVYRVEVRDHLVKVATRNGSPLRDQRSLGAWSVPVMFDTIAVDLRAAKNPIRINPKEVQGVTPLGVFHPQYGYPERYRRVQWGADMDASWVVTSFHVVKYSMHDWTDKVVLIS